MNSVLTQPKRVAFLAYLALARPRGLHRRDTLLALFWPELPESQGRAALRQALFFLRRSLGSDVFATRGAGEVGIDRTLLRTDVDEVEAALTAGNREGPGGRARAAAAHAALETLTERSLLDGLHVGGLPEFERWLDGERSRLRELAREAVGQLAREAAAAGDLAGAARSAELGLRLDPLDEKAARRLLELKLRAGDRSGARKTWAELEGRYRQELAEEPALDFESLLASVRPDAPGATGGEPKSAVAAAAADVVESPPAVPMAGEQEPPARPSRAGPAAPPTAPAGLARRRTDRRIAVALQAVGLLALAVGIGAIALYPRVGSPPAADPDLVAVFPPTVRGPVQGTDLSRSLVPLIAEKLEEGGGGRVLSPHSVLEEVDGQDGPVHLEQAGEIAARLGAGRLLLTDIAAVGDSLLATASLYRTGGGEEARIGVAVTERSDLAGTARRIASLLLARLALVEGRTLQALAAQTTDSLGAYRRFAAAEADYRAGELRPALTGFTAALRIDPTFALAWYRMFLISPLVLGTPPAAGSADGLDVDRLPNPHGLLLAAARAAWLGNAGAAEELAARAAALEDDAEIWAFLGALRLAVTTRSGGDVESARRALERARRVDPGHPLALQTLRAYAHLMEDSALMDSLATATAGSYTLTRDPALLPARVRRRFAELHALEAIAAGHWTEGIASARATDDASSRVTGELADYTGAPVVRARVLLTPFARPAPADLQDCITGLRSWRPATPSGRAERDYLLARLLLASGEGEEAVRLVAGLTTAPADTPEARRRAATYAAAIRIDHALRRGATAEAVEVAEGLDLTDDLRLGPVLLHESRSGAQWLVAEALFAAGRLEEASQWYQGLGAGSSSHFLQARRVRLGQIRERLGDPEDARRWYRRVVESLGVPDPELQAPLDTAGRALARLDGVRGILWVDDAPENNIRERGRLGERGVAVTVALSTDEALARFDPRAFQLVISDIGRYEDGVYRPRAGLELLSRLRESGAAVRIVFFTSERAVAAFRDAVLGAGADGITASTEELYRLIGPVGRQPITP